MAIAVISTGDYLPEDNPQTNDPIVLVVRAQREVLVLMLVLMMTEGGTEC